MKFMFYSKLISGKISISLIIFFTLTTVTVTGSLSEDLAMQGIIFEKAGDYERALECYRQASANAQSHVYKYDQMKMSLEYELGQYSDAEQTKKIINKTTSGDENCYKGLEFHGTFANGIKLLNSNKYDEAIEKFKKALDYCPLDTDTQILIGYLIAKKENNEVALKYLDNQKLISGILWKQKGDLLKDMLRIEEAKIAYQEALRRDPGLEEAEKALNVLNNEQQEPSRIITTPTPGTKHHSINNEKQFKTSTPLSPDNEKNEKNPDSSSDQRKPVQIAHNTKEEFKVIPFRENFDDISIPSISVEWNQKGVEAYNQGNITHAINCFDNALDTYPQYATAWKNIGLAYAKNEQYIDSIKTYLFVIRTIDASDAGVYNNLGYSYYYYADSFSPDEKSTLLARSLNSLNLALNYVENSEEISIITDNINVVERKREKLIVSEKINEKVVENVYLILVFSGIIFTCYIIWHVFNFYFNKKELESKEELMRRLETEEKIREALKEKNEVIPIPQLVKKK